MSTPAAARERPKPRLCARVRGGLGNQLFIYATARALALRNDAELLLDNHSAYFRDPARTYRLDLFGISARPAPLTTAFVSVPRWQRTPVRFLSRLLPHRHRAYLEQPWLRHVPELLTLRLSGDVYLDGFWQDPAYFNAQAAILRNELVPRSAPSPENQTWLDRIQAVPSVAVHCRRTDSPVFIPPSFYYAAAERLAATRPIARYFVFSDEPDWACSHIRLPGPTTFVTHNGFHGEIEDFRLMTACTHFITANSTFSWWAAWLGNRPGKHVITPAPFHEWGTACRLPPEWEQIDAFR